ncbi:MAG TPA: winged helix-turn-helix transcriptional regulator [Chloroflexi bacterium]|nr:winged helix-turn-helix transcriptional regulator [Chloroflexota bacterium]
MTDNILNIGKVILDLDNGQLKGPNGQCHLNRMEIKLLSAFMRHPGKVLTRAFLMKAVWETDYLGDTRTLDVHISWLRKKLKKCASQQQYLKTVRGVGYWLGDA